MTEHMFVLQITSTFKNIEAEILYLQELHLFQRKKYIHKFVNEKVS
jgi:hypothetical protein